MQAGQFGIEHRRSAQAQALASVRAGSIDVEDWRRAWGEAGGSVGASQVLKFGVRGDFRGKVLDGHAGVKAVGVDLVQVSQTGRTAKRLCVQHSRRKRQDVNKNEGLSIWYLFLLTFHLLCAGTGR